jgi:signal transduction histidine kinase
MLADAVFTVVIFALVAGLLGPRHGALIGDHRSAWLAAVLDVLLVMPLIWRRRYPLQVFGVMCLAAGVQWTIGIALFSDAALLVGLYTVAALRERGYALAAAGLLELGVVLAMIRWSQPAGILTGIVFLTGMATAAFVLGVNIRTRRAYLASLEDRAVRAERERDHQAQLAAAGERARIAREMHDIVAHNLSVMIALADGAAFAAQNNAEGAEAAAKQVSATGRQALTEMHRLLGVLRAGGPLDTTDTPENGPRAPQPGIDQIDDLVAQVRGAGLPTSLTLIGQRFPVPPTAQLAAYRVVQEALTNILKHAKDPTEARITLNYAEPALILTVSDDGQDTPPAREAELGGHGVSGMRERAAVFGGWVDAGPRPVRGWQVRAVLSPGSMADPAAVATSVRPAP